MPIPSLRPDYESLGKDTICVFAQTNFRNQMRRFGIKLDDRRRHMYIVGKTGMGKSTMMENMVLDDIYSGNGIGLVDPHGDFAEKILNYIPAKRINDVVYINPADLDFPIGFNILEVHNEGQKHLIVAGLMGIFKKIWPDVWSARMEYILNNTLLALIEYPGSTLLGINRLLSDKKYRRKVIAKVKDPVIKSFWNVEFASYTEKYAQEAVAPIQNKIGQFLSTNVIRNMVAQVKSTIDIRKLMDEGKIIIMNLSKGRIGEDNSRLLGGMLITKIQLAAMERVDTPEKDRRDFFLYVDEFQNFATPSFANILSEARKYRLSLIMAHQYVKQLDEIVADAVFGNVGTIISFRIGGGDAEMLAKEFTPVFLEEDLVNLPKFQIFLKLMIDGVSSTPFSAMTLPPLGGPTDSVDKVIRVSRERYGRPRAAIEDKIMRWAGLEGDLVDEDDEDENGELLAPSFDDLGAPTLPSPVLPPASASSALPVENVVSELPSVSEEPTLHLDSLIPRDHVVKRDAPLVENSAPIQFDSLDELSPSPKSDSPIPSASLSAANASPFVSADGEKKKRRRRRRRKSGAGGGSAS
ncbi:MAG: hypothetical protein A3B90_02710 [Candidatus Magasanikbacteria bacterium RIFCSPHIGHO2_02_FULL_41_13]|uniref:Type IV secretion system coupling protein TraD DNA-binding domain-containing protein n=1 Tax=Candidatus Magasanikbacteria bacterium RIFCSPHIGHO2_02_FULL_41_13 TaxID=1798676 RepID=A0A1F6M583_9BACT|nr:MAG: hypothetical protein A3B90_02710 [Candidatus Magasanikbacteria bacterium RIFCSPHIGHO2_02_FULL_41_13]